MLNDFATNLLANIAPGITRSPVQPQITRTPTGITRTPLHGVANAITRGHSPAWAHRGAILAALLGQPQHVPVQADPVEGDGRVIMSNTANGPVYYGTPEAQQLALRGLERVKAVYGTSSSQYRSALNAALGVLGPDYYPGG